MNSSVRFWIVILVLTSFLAGGAGGVLVGLKLSPPAATPGAFADFEQLLVEHFELTGERARGLRVVLDQYQRRIENIKSRNAESLEPELAKLGLTFRGVVRDTVLPADRRDEFTRMSSGIFPSSLPE
ncbi:MAG: putative membrane protein [Planctomycetota bacterium]